MFTPLTKVFTTSTLLLLLTEQSWSNCLIEGDMMFMPGQQIDTTSLQCIEGSDTKYEGHANICNEDGTITRKLATFECDKGLYCVQCGPRRRGGAFCLPTKTTEMDCDFPDDYNFDGCLVGNRNDVIGVGETATPTSSYCMGDTMYNSMTRTCGDNLYIDIGFNQGTCPEGTKCVQVNDDIACTSIAVPAEEVVNGEELLKPINDGSFTPDIPVGGLGECRVDDMIFMEGHELGTVGLECVDDSTYHGHVELCGQNGNVERHEVTMTCPKDTFCVQCGPRRRGGANCLGTKETNLDCTFPQDYKDEGCLVGERREAITVGETYEETAKECIDNTSYRTVTSACGQNWYLNYKYGVATCPEDYPTCVDNDDGGSDCVDDSGRTSTLDSASSGAFKSNPLISVPIIALYAASYLFEWAQ